MIHRVSLFILAAIFVACQSKVSQEEQESQAPEAEEVLYDTLKDNVLDDFQHLVEDFESPQRSEWQNPELVIMSFGELDGKTIADIGAGTGYFTFKIAQKGATVLAIDIDQQFLDYIEERKAELDDVISYDQVQTIHSLDDDPLLPQSGVHGALLVNTYHFLENRVNYMTKIKEGLKEDGTVVIVDYKLGDLPFGPEESFKVPAEQVKEELTKAGFSEIELDKDSLPYQYLITAKR